jgi:hypothetical protein
MHYIPSIQVTIPIPVTWHETFSWLEINVGEWRRDWRYIEEGSTISPAFYATHATFYFREKDKDKALQFKLIFG